MIVSPASISEARPSMVLLVMSPAGTMTQAALGVVSLLTKSAIELAPVAPSSSSAFTAPGFTSNTTQLWPSRIRRRTMFAPIRPSPTMPSCIGLLVVMVALLVVVSGRRPRREPRLVPGRVPADQVGRAGRAPRSPRVGGGPGAAGHVVEQRLEDPPGFLDGVLPGEPRVVAGQRVV